MMMMLLKMIVKPFHYLDRLLVLVLLNVYTERIDFIVYNKRKTSKSNALIGFRNHRIKEAEIFFLLISIMASFFFSFFFFIDQFNSPFGTHSGNVHIQMNRERSKKIGSIIESIPNKHSIYIYICVCLPRTYARVKLLDAMICGIAHGMKYRHEMMDIHNGRKKKWWKVNLVVLVDELSHSCLIQTLRE
jgi:hypothetical protein